MKALADKAKAAGKLNVSFLCLFLLQEIDQCIALLTERCMGMVMRRTILHCLVLTQC